MHRLLCPRKMHFLLARVATGLLDLHLLCCQNTFSVLPVLHTGNLLSIKGRIIALFSQLACCRSTAPLQLRVWFSQNGKFRQGDMLQMCFWHRPSILWLLKPARMEKHFGPCQQDLNGLSLPLPAASTLHVLILIPDSSRNSVLLLLLFFYIFHSWMVYTVPQLFYLGEKGSTAHKEEEEGFYVFQVELCNPFSCSPSLCRRK